MRIFSRISAWLWLPLALAAFMPPSAARAAQNAEVVEDGAAVHEAPQDGSPEIDFLNRGSVVRVSSETRDGWYKVVVPGRHPPTFGWVKGSALRPSTLTRDIDAAGIQRYSQAPPEWPIHRIVLNAGARGIHVSPADLQEALGFDSASVIGLGFGAELGYRLSTQWTVGARFYSNTLAEEKGDATYSVGLSGFGAYGEWTFFHKLPFKVGLSLGAGTLSATFSGKAADGSDVELTGKESMILLPAKLTFQWYPLTNVALSLAAGYQYVLSAAPFVDGAGNEVPFNASAPFAEAGLQIEF